MITYEYHIVGIRPVQLLYDDRRFRTALKFDWESGVFVSGAEYFAEATMWTGDTEEVDQAEFVRQTENPRAERVAASGRLAELYAAIRAINAPVRADWRHRLAAEERARLATLQRESYALFEQTLAPQIYQQLGIAPMELRWQPAP